MASSSRCRAPPRGSPSTGLSSTLFSPWLSTAARNSRSCSTRRSPVADPAPQVFLASRNAKKLAEMQRILIQHAPGVVVLGLDDVPSYDEPVEDQPTFAGNALLKARAAV